GDRIVLMGTIWPPNLELTIRGIFNPPQPTQSVYFDRKYLEEAVPVMKDQSGTFGILANSPADVPKVATAVDDMFHNSPQRTKTESEKAFGMDFVAMLGNVKAFILSICGAVVFATLLVAANTMAMSIRERTREVAVLKTLGFTRKTVLALFVGEAVVVAAMAGPIGVGLGSGVMDMVGAHPQGRLFPGIWGKLENSGVRSVAGERRGASCGHVAFLQRLARGYRGGSALHRVADSSYGDSTQLQHSQSETAQGPDHHDRARHCADGDHGRVPDGAARRIEAGIR